MKILAAVIAHDQKMDVLSDVLSSVLKLEGVDSRDLFAFDTEKKCVELAEKMGIKTHTFPRPLIDHEKITFGYVSLQTGMRETELAQLAWLRNATLDYTVKNGYDYLYFIDADILVPKDAISRLLKLDCDVALGWHFHKRLPVPAAQWPMMKHEDIDRCFREKRVVEGKNGTFGGVLIKREVCENVSVELYNSDQAEDGLFYKKVTAAGYSMKIDLGLNYPHLGTDWKPKAIKFMEEKTKLWKIT